MKKKKQQQQQTNKKKQQQQPFWEFQSILKLFNSITNLT